jgi:O-acetyl-ADP-ribose deacetylase (regulator of RNase III)
MVIQYCIFCGSVAEYMIEDTNAPICSACKIIYEYGQGRPEATFVNITMEELNMATEIKYVKGDATKPIGEGLKIICHVCNDKNKWGAGFVLALSKKWKKPEADYRKWAKYNVYSCPFELGYVQMVRVENDIVVANMIGQHDIRTIDGVPPVRYEAIRECLQKVSHYAKENKASVHAPRFGAGLSGGKWELIEKIIESTLCENNIPVTVYDID